MRRLKRFAQRPSADRRLLLEAWFLVALVRTGLWLAPLNLVRRAALQSAQNPRRRSTVDRIAWSVITAGRYFPRATCLTQALAVHALLDGSGHTSRIEIGVAKDAARCFEAHAWVVCNGAIVLGGAEAIRYTPLLALGEVA